MASTGREGWTSAARRLVPFALVVLALSARGGELSLVLQRLESGPPVSRLTYLPRFTEIADAGGRPYRDFPVEYPPVSLAAIEFVGGKDPNETGVRLVWLMVLCDALTAAALALGWGRRASVAYLALTVPLLGFLYTTIDLLPVALATASVALVVRGRERAGGLAMAAAVLAKVWPIAVVPLFVVQRKARALGWTVGGLVVSVAWWVVWGGMSGPIQVATQRHTPGWEYESTVGSLLWAFTGSEIRSVNDSSRLGVAPGWAKALLLAAAVAGIVAVWRRAAAQRSPEVGFPALAAVSILLLSAPLLSHPFVIWLAPWAAIAASERRGYVRALAVALMLVSGLLVVSYSSALPEVALWSVKLTLLLRNALIAAIPVAYFLERQTTSVVAVGPQRAYTRVKIRPSASS